jgi:hypothetical protein
MTVYLFTNLFDGLKSVRLDPDFEGSIPVHTALLFRFGFKLDLSFFYIVYRVPKSVLPKVFCVLCHLCFVCCYALSAVS